MSSNLLYQAQQFLKLSGRIAVERYNKQIYEIINKISNFMDSPRMWKLEDKPVDLEPVIFPFRGIDYTLNLKVICDSHVPIKAGVNVTIKNPYLIVNLQDFQYIERKYSMALSDKLLPVITHEVTHFLDYLYDPLSAKIIEEKEVEAGGFYKEFRDLFLTFPSRINYGDLETFRGKDITQIATRDVIKFTKSKPYKYELSALLSKYNMVLDSDVLGKMIKLIHSLYLEDMSIYRDTGGDMFGMSDKKKTNTVRDVATKLYYRSNAEIKAYTNEIISQIDHRLLLEPFLIEFVKGQASISTKLDYLLARSPTFAHIKDKLTQEQLNHIYREIANFFTKNYSRRTTVERAEKSDVPNFSSKDELSYRYIKHLMKSNPDKLSELIKDDKFRSDNIKALLLVKDDLDFSASLKKIKETMPKFDDFTSSTPED